MRHSAVNKYFFFGAAWRWPFLITLFFVILASFLFWLETFHVYQSEVSVLVIGKETNVASDQLVENFVELSRNLSFYERVLSSNDRIEDDFEGYSKDKRKELWNEAVRVTQSNKSGVLIVTARQETRERAILLSRETARVLLSVAAFYYNIKTDIDIRIVDEPIVKVVVSDPIRYVLTAVFSALAITIVFFSLLSAVPHIFSSRSKRSTPPHFPTEAGVPFFNPQKFIPTRPQSLSYEPNHGKQETFRKDLKNEGFFDGVIDDESQNFSEEDTIERMLPGMETSELPFQFEESYPDEQIKGGLDFVPDENKKEPDDILISPSEEESVVPQEVIKSGEPTVDEYKRRLNELLSGGK